MTTQTQSQGAMGAVLGASVIGLIIAAAVALMNLSSQGHASFNTGSNGVTWGLPVATYVFFVLTSTGLTFVASLAMVFNLKGFYPIAKRCVWMAVVTLIAGFASLALELGHPFRMLWAIPTSFQILSPLNWMGVFYALYLVLLLLKFSKVQAGDWDSSASKKLGVASFVSVILAHGMLGAVFGMMAMRPMWYGPLVPIYFLLTAALSGAAFAVLITQLAYGANAPANVKSLVEGPLSKAFATVLGIVLVATAARVLTGLWSNADGLQVWDHIVASPWFLAEIALMVASFLMLVKGSTPGVPALMTIVALFIGRYEFVIGGQLVPMFKGSWVPDLIQYTPSLTEWMLTLLAVSIAFAGYALGDRMFNLSDAPKN